MYALCVSGAVNMQGFVWKFFLCTIYKNSLIQSSECSVANKTRPTGGVGRVCVVSKGCSDQLAEREKDAKGKFALYGSFNPVSALKKHLTRHEIWQNIVTQNRWC